MFNNFLKQQKTQLEKQIKTIEQSIQERTNYLQDINSQITATRQRLDRLQTQIAKCNQQLSTYQQEIGVAEGVITMQDYGMEYEPCYNDIDKIANEKFKVEHKIAAMIGTDKVVLTTREYRVDGSESKGNKFQKAYCENLIVGFVSYYNKKKKTVTQTNIKKTEELIRKKFDTINKKGDLLGVSISKEYLELCVKLLYLDLDDKIAKTEERERIKEERRRLREQEKMLAEAEKVKLELQKQRRMYKQSLAKALDEQERQEFEAKLKEIDKREADVDYRIHNSRAGYLYVTATKAMPEYCKIGVTRRLNPLVRISELSSASVPYPFVCYGLVFSDDAFDLETRVHDYFDKQRVNKENKHKEFFNITPQEAIKVLKEEFDCDVHFINEEESEDEE